MSPPDRLVHSVDTARGTGVPLRAVSQRTPPLAGFTDEGRAREARSVAGVLGQRRVGVDLGLGNREPLLEIWKGSPSASQGVPGIRVVPLQAAPPEPRLA